MNFILHIKYQLVMLSMRYEKNRLWWMMSHGGAHSPWLSPRRGEGTLHNNHLTDSDQNNPQHAAEVYTGTKLGTLQIAL